MAQSSSIRGKYEELGVQKYYMEHGSDYSNPHFATLKEVVPRMLDQLLRPLLPLKGGVLDLCCGAGEFTLIFRAWHSLQPCSASGGCCPVTGADPYTGQGYERATGMKAEAWSFDDVCSGALEDAGVAFDVVTISYAIHLLDRSRYFAFFQSLARHARRMLIISPTKNKGLVEEAHGWREAEYISDQKVHARLYESISSW